MHSNTCHKTYAALDIEAVRNADAHDGRGDSAFEPGTKVGQKYQLGNRRREYQLAKMDEAK